MRKRFAFVTCMLLAAILPANADVPGSADHPLMSRFPESEITWYETQNFEPYRIAVGPVTGYRTIEKWVDVEGKTTRINYVLTGDRGFYEVYANYLEALRKAGFKVLAEGFDKTSNVKGAVGQRGFLGVHYGANVIPPGKSNLLHGSSTSAGSGYVAATLERPEGAVHVIVGVAQYKQNEIVALVDIIESKQVETGLVTVDAAAMSRDIDTLGKVALYGLFFDHDKGTLKAESKPALVEIARLLKNRPDLNVYVVGHTDLAGTLAYNLKLSRDRAESVVADLVRNHGVAASRVEAQGVGPLVPVASNGGDAGRAKNRRVELVQK